MSSTIKSSFECKKDISAINQRMRKIERKQEKAYFC